MMADHIDDYAAIGQAMTANQAEVAASNQRLRSQAYAAGGLRTNDKQTVEVQQVPNQPQPVYVIQPANPQVVYIPQYNPTVVYAPPSTGTVVATSLISFGVGIGIGVLLANNHPWGWGGWGWGWGHGVYYNRGPWGGVWVGGYRPPVYWYQPAALLRRPSRIRRQLALSPTLLPPTLSRAPARVPPTLALSGQSWLSPTSPSSANQSSSRISPANDPAGSKQSRQSPTKRDSSGVKPTQHSTHSASSSHQTRPPESACAAKPPGTARRPGQTNREAFAEQAIKLWRNPPLQRSLDAHLPVRITGATRKLVIITISNEPSRSAVVSCPSPATFDQAFEA
jgi:hypothetical protein